MGPVYRRWRALAVLLAAPAGLALAGAISPGSWANRLLEAERTGEPIPVVSAGEETALTLDRAYAIQSAYVTARQHGGARIAGFKAGLTTQAGRENFGVDEPLAGVLFEAGRHPEGADVSLDGYHAPRIEVEIAFVLGEPVTGTVENIEALKDRVRVVAPAVELPELGFAEPSALTGPDIAAANVVSRGFILGPALQPPDGRTLGSLSATLERGGTTVNTGKGADALGDPWHAALWLTNKAAREGYRLEPGHVLLTGALGGMVEARPGRYTARIEDLGEVEFELR